MEERSFSQGMIFGIVIIVLMFGGLYYMLSAPTSLNGGLIEPSNTPYKDTINVTLYANALGWDYGVKGDHTNPTFNITVGTRIVFTVIEADTAPHTLTIADSPSESSTHLTLITTSQLTQVIGHTVTVSYVFNKIGAWTYWCEIHATTMVGRINVLASTNTSAIANCHVNPDLAQHHSQNNNNLNSIYESLLDVSGAIIA